MLCHLLLSLSLAASPKGASTFHCLDPSFCCDSASDSSHLSESDVAMLSMTSDRYKETIYQFDRGYLPTLCAKSDPRLAGLLLELLKELAGYKHQLCCGPYILAQVRLREPDREKVADLLVSDLKLGCSPETWLQCFGSPVHTYASHGLRALAREGNVAVFRKLLRSTDGVSRLAALEGLGVFLPRITDSYVPPPRVMRQLFPDLVKLFADENDNVQAAAIGIVACLANDKKELDEFLS